MNSSSSSSSSSTASSTSLRSTSSPTITTTSSFTSSSPPSATGTDAPVSCYSDTKTPNVTFTVNDAQPQIEAFCKKFNGRPIGESESFDVIVDTIDGSSTSTSIVLSATLFEGADGCNNIETKATIQTTSCIAYLLEAVNECEFIQFPFYSYIKD